MAGPVAGAEAGPVAASAARPASAARGVVAAIACIAIFGAAIGMTHPLLGLRLEQAGYSSALIGLNAATPALAALTLAPFMPRLIAAAGLPAFLTAGALLSSVTVLLFPVFDGYLAWLALRFALGAAATALFVGSEAWIVAGAAEGARGRVVGVYATMLSIGYAAGPASLILIGLDGWAPFLAVAAGGLLCALPLAAAWRDAPRADPDDSGGVSSFRFFLTDPMVLGAVVLFGAVEFGVMGLLPVWGVKVGLGQAAATGLISILVLGNVLFQIPLGLLADRLDRRRMLVFCAATSLIAAALLPALAATRAPLWAVLFVWGGLVVGLYTVALVELGARYRGRALVSANAAIVVAYGIGALVGPALVGAAMDWVPPHGLSIALAAMTVAYLALAAARMRRGGRPRPGTAGRETA